MTPPSSRKTPRRTPRTWEGWTFLNGKQPLYTTHQPAVARFWRTYKQPYTCIRVTITEVLPRQK